MLQALCWTWFPSFLFCVEFCNLSTHLVCGRSSESKLEALLVQLPGTTILAQTFPGCSAVAIVSSDSYGLSSSMEVGAVSLSGFCMGRKCLLAECLWTDTPLGNMNILVHSHFLLSLPIYMWLRGFKTMLGLMCTAREKPYTILFFKSSVSIYTP